MPILAREISCGCYCCVFSWIVFPNRMDEMGREKGEISLFSIKWCNQMQCKMPFSHYKILEIYFYGHYNVSALYLSFSLRMYECVCVSFLPLFFVCFFGWAEWGVKKCLNHDKYRLKNSNIQTMKQKKNNRKKCALNLENSRSTNRTRAPPIFFEQYIVPYNEISTNTHFN